MKLQVNGIEEIEITDPKGLCQLNQLQGIPMGRQPLPPSTPPQLPQPMIPTPFGPTPGTIGPFRPVFPGNKQSVWTRGLDPKTKWGIGGPMIQQASQEVDPEKWQENWKGSVEPEDGGNVNGNTG